MSSPDLAALSVVVLLAAALAGAYLGRRFLARLAAVLAGTYLGKRFLVRLATADFRRAFLPVLSAVALHLLVAPWL